MDALSELLRVVKLRGAMFFDAYCAAPWCVQSPPSRELCSYIDPVSTHVIEFHLVADGRGYIRVGAESTPLTPGDIVMLPHGDAHQMGNGSDMPIVESGPGVSALLRGDIQVLRLGGSGEPTRLICGYLAGDSRLLRPALAGLPRVLRVNLRNDESGMWLESMMRHAVLQLSTAAAGSEVIVARLAELMFAEVLRRYVLQLPETRTGWLAAAADPAVGRALALLHRSPGEAWTLESLAEASGISRSALTDRFARCLGQSPMAYLADWRLELAADALRSTRRSVLSIAGEVGYESEAAFNRAFKRHFTEPPARYRKQWAARSAGAEPVTR